MKWNSMSIILITISGLILFQSCNGQQGELNVQKELIEVDSLITIKDFQTAINKISYLKKKLDNPTILYKYEAFYYFSIGNIKEAVKLFNDARKYEPLDPYILTYLGKSYSINNQPLESEKYFLQALDIDSNYSFAAFNLANFYANYGYYKLALDAMEKYIPLSDKSQAELFMYYLLYHLNRKIDKRDSIDLMIDKVATKEDYKKLRELLILPIGLAEVENSHWVVENIEEPNTIKMDLQIFNYKVTFESQNRLKSFEDGELMEGYYKLSNRSLFFYDLNDKLIASFELLLLDLLKKKLVLYEINNQTTTTFLKLQ